MGLTRGHVRRLAKAVVEYTDARNEAVYGIGRGKMPYIEPVYSFDVLDDMARAVGAKVAERRGERFVIREFVAYGVEFYHTEDAEGAEGGDA